MEVRIESVTGAAESAVAPVQVDDFENLDAFGIWADRPEMASYRSEVEAYRQRYGVSQK